MVVKLPARFSSFLDRYQPFWRHISAGDMSHRKQVFSHKARRATQLFVPPFGANFLFVIGPVAHATGIFCIVLRTKVCAIRQQLRFAYDEP